MAMPNFAYFIRPVLESVAELKTVDKARQTIPSFVAEKIGLTEDDLKMRIPCGKSMVKNRCGWALTYLTKAKLIKFPVRGQAEITPEGANFLHMHNGAIMIKDLYQFPSFAEFSNVRPTNSNAYSISDTANMNSFTDPDETIDIAINTIVSTVASDIANILKDMTPSAFEQLVIELLDKIFGNVGFSEHTGRSGDFGIDGIVYLDKLGLEKVYIQAKRWQNSVGHDELHNFAGALEGKKAKKGVFITTSKFTPNAIEYAKNNSNSLVLIDGASLVDLMISHNVGVTCKRTINIPAIDREYFDV